MVMPPSPSPQQICQDVKRGDNGKPWDGTIFDQINDHKRLKIRCKDGKVVKVEVQKT